MSLNYAARLKRMSDFFKQACVNLFHLDVVSKSQLFDPDSYKSIYMKKNGFGLSPLLHYMLLGEYNGARPNVFFDPIFFKQVSGVGQFWKYLTDTSLWDHSTSKLFDGRYYRSHLGSAERLARNPLQDFWLEGFDESRAGSEVFDTAFFKRATARDIWDKKAFATTALRTPESSILSYVDLKKLQDSFYQAINFRLLKNQPSNRRNLVFVQSSCAHTVDFLDTDRSFDLFLNYYEACDVPDPRCDIAATQSGTKVTAIRKILELHPELLISYDYVLFLDDDVGITKESIEEFFRIMRAEGLDLAQPALSDDTDTYHRHLKRSVVGNQVKSLSTVEIMMPGLSQRALRECGWVFSTGISGWGVDLLLGATIHRTFSTRAAVIGQCVGSHLKPCDTENGRFYQFLLQRGISANVEAGAIALRYGLDDSETGISLIDSMAHDD